MIHDDLASVRIACGCHELTRFFQVFGVVDDLFIACETFGDKSVDRSRSTAHDIVDDAVIVDSVSDRTAYPIVL